jgi:hypothetical protein
MLQIGPQVRGERIPVSASQRVSLELTRWRIFSPWVVLIAPMPSGSPEADIDGAVAALNEIVRRHEILRTFVVEDTMGWSQHVARESDVQFDVVDLSRENSPKALGYFKDKLLPEFRAMANADVSGFLPRTRFVIFPDGRSAMLLACRRFMMDPVSQGVLLREFEALSALSNGHSGQLPELPMQYVDFAIWEDRTLPSDESVFADHRTGLLGARRTSLALDPGDRGPFRRGILHIDLPQAVVRTCNGLALNLKVQQRHIVLAAVYLLLSCWTNQPEIVAGLVLNGRPRGTELLIGPFLRLRPLFANVAPSQTFAALINELKIGEAAAVDARNSTNAGLIADLGLCDLTINIAAYTAKYPGQRPASRTPLSISAFPNFDTHASLTILESAAGEVGQATLEIAAEIVDNAKAAWFARTLPAVLEDALADSRSRVGALQSKYSFPREIRASLR